MRLLIAEDDKALGLFLSRGLEADGHRVRLACDGGAAVEAFRQEMPDLTILDLNMPVKDGEQVLEELRALDAELPVLVLTARQEVDTRVRCLDRGADDLMIKPFSLHELRARCRALLRRKREARLQLRAGDLELDRLDHTARRGGLPIVLTNKEFALLEHLMLNRGQCVSRVELLDSVWNLEPAQTTNIVDVYVNYLRRKLKDPPPGQLIRTVRGQGYMVPSETELALVAPVPRLPSSGASGPACGEQSSLRIALSSIHRFQSQENISCVSVPVPALPVAPRIRPRTALVASADRSFRQRLSEILTGLRWQVREAEGGAQAWAEAEAAPPEAVIVDSWLPDLDLAEFLKDFRGTFPQVDLVTAGGGAGAGKPARALPPGTALCSAPLPGHRYGCLEYGARARTGQMRTAQPDAAPASAVCGGIGRSGGNQPRRRLSSAAHGIYRQPLSRPCGSGAILPLAPATRAPATGCRR